VTTAERDNNRIVITFPQRVDTAYCQENEKAILGSAGQGCRGVDFDLRGVEYVCSAFLRICMQVLKLVGKDRFRITGCSPGLRKVFKIACYDGLMIIE